VAGAACRGDRNAASGLPIPGENGARVTVEMLNATGKPGLAKVGTRLLRRASIDVVAFGNAPDSVGGGTLDSTRIVVQLDSGRLLDASVFLGVDFAPTGLEFHP